jgi:hypothetical protein
MQEEIVSEVKRQFGDGGGGNMSDLERRVGNLETDVRSIRDNLNLLVTDVTVIRSNFASKTDIADLKTELKIDISGIKTEIANSAHTQTRWIIATIITVISVSIAIQRFLPPPQSAQPQAQPSVNISQPEQHQSPPKSSLK